MLSLTLLALAAQCAAATTAAASNFTAAVGWYASWHVEAVPLTSVLWSKYTHMTYAFAVPTADPSAISLAESDQELLPQFVAAAHKNGIKAGLSIGGWGGSQFYSSNLGSAKNRTAFVKSTINLIQKYHLDLVDFDWEFPGFQGIGCNTVSPADSDNLLAMLKELRASPAGANVTLTAATDVKPFPNTNASTIAEFASVLDWIVPMVYDRSWNWTQGSPRIQRALPSAPLDDSCFASAPGVTGTGLTGLGSARSATETWVSAGFPASKIVLGVPSYGHGFNVNKTEAFLASTSPDGHSLLTPYPPYDTLNHTVGDKWDSTGGTNLCGAYSGPGGTYNFFSLVAAGYLLSNGSAAPNVAYQWDTCSSTPYLYVADRGVLISYDDPRSFTAKGAFVRANGLAGFAMWEVGGDPQGVLLDAILSAPANASLTVTPSGAVPAPASASAVTKSSGAVQSRTWPCTMTLLLAGWTSLYLGIKL